MNIGIIGLGVVGSANKAGFDQLGHTVVVHDTKLNTTIDAVQNTECVFVCVPTPSKPNGDCNTDIVESVIKEIDDCNHEHKPTVVIKSTVPPGTTDRLHKKYKNIDVIFNPEFLTEMNFIEDFKNQSRIILGGVRRGTSLLRQVYSKVFPHATIVKTNAKYAETVKYFINCFLGTKVSFANEMKMLCDEIDIDYDKVVEYATYDERLGKSHWAVPGPDGELGFGGHCLPKDISAIVSGYDDMELLQAVLKVNDKVRKNRDWEEMKGRAVI